MGDSVVLQKYLRGVRGRVVPAAFPNDKDGTPPSVVLDGDRIAGAEFVEVIEDSREVVSPAKVPGNYRATSFPGTRPQRKPGHLRWAFWHRHRSAGR